MRTLIQNMIIGVTTGFEKKLELNGVGFRVALEGNKLKMALGFSHDVYYEIPAAFRSLSNRTSSPSLVLVNSK